MRFRGRTGRARRCSMRRTTSSSGPSSPSWPAATRWGIDMARVLTACVFLLTATGAADQDDVKAMQGTWVIESATFAGRDHTEDFAGMKLIIDGNRYTVDFGKNTDKGTFTLDPTKTPKRIDIMSA